MSKNICTRCGKQRVVGSKIEEQVETYSGMSTIVRTQMICPDPECQAIVEKELHEQQEKRAMFKKESEQRQANRRHHH
jgi:aspartate/tyrosine/aromatic aminotransferase